MAAPAAPGRRPDPYSLAVYYYAIHSRLGPERVVRTVSAYQEDLDLGLAEHV